MREYFECPGCGKRTWRNTVGLFTDRDKCVACWNKDPPSGVHHCIECGRFAIAGSNYCWKCQRLMTLETRVNQLHNDLQNELAAKTVCQTKNVELKSQVVTLDKKVQGFQEKQNYPFKLIVHEYNGACTKGYLEDVLKAAQIVPHVIRVEYSRR